MWMSWPRMCETCALASSELSAEKKPGSRSTAMTEKPIHGSASTFLAAL